MLLNLVLVIIDKSDIGIYFMVIMMDTVELWHQF